MSELSRRRLLAAAGVAGASAVAGCTGAADEPGDGGDGDDENENGTSGTQLGEITVENLDDGDHTVDVLVEFDGEIEHWSTHEFDEENRGVTLEAEWPDEPGAFRVTARLNEDEFTQVDPGNWSGPACINLIVLIQRDGSIQIAGVTDGGPCGGGDVDVGEAEVPTDDDADAGNTSD